MEAWMDACMDGWMHGWMDGWMDARVDNAPGMSSTCNSKNRLRRACDSCFLPPYAPAGFWVAHNMKLGCGFTWAPAHITRPHFSVNTNETLLS